MMQNSETQTQPLHQNHYPPKHSTLTIYGSRRVQSNVSHLETLSVPLTCRTTSRIGIVRRDEYSKAKPVNGFLSLKSKVLATGDCCWPQYLTQIWNKRPPTLKEYLLQTSFFSYSKDRFLNVLQCLPKGAMHL